MSLQCRGIVLNSYIVAHFSYLFFLGGSDSFVYLYNTYFISRGLWHLLMGSFWLWKDDTRYIFKINLTKK